MTLQSPGMFGSAEGPELEWKERMPQHDRAAATLCAFANGNGGSLFIGVRNDGTVCGVVDAAAVCAQLRDRARSRIDPPLSLRLVRHADDLRIVVEARIAARPGEPAAVIGARGARRVYVREGSSSRPASPAEVKALRLRVPGGAPSAAQRRVLELLRRLGPAPLRAIAGALNVGMRTARRQLVDLVDHGFVLERDDRRFWLTPRGIARMDGSRGGSR